MYLKISSSHSDIQLTRFLSLMILVRFGEGGTNDNFSVAKDGGCMCHKSGKMNVKVVW